MLPKKSRLNLTKSHNQQIFKAAYKTSSHFKIFYRFSEQRKFKATVVMPIKLFRKAVWRNKWRRKVYALVESHQICKLPVELALICIRNLKNDKEWPAIKKDLEEKLDEISQEVLNADN
jgi:ribonuclease P protein component